MKKSSVFISGIFLLTTSLAVAGENVTHSEHKLKEKTTHSTTIQEGVGQPEETNYKSTTIEQQRKSTTSDDGDSKTTTREKVEVKKERSDNTNNSGQSSSGSNHESHYQSERHERTIKTVE